MIRLPAALGSFSALLLALQTSACGACDTTGQSPIEYREGLTTNSAGGVWIYESTAVSDDWLHFPAGRIYDLVHGLPGTPQSWSADVSFKSRLEPDAGSGTTQDPNNAAPAAGNQVVVDANWGDRIVRIRNDTCAEVYVRFVAQYVDGQTSSAGTATDTDDTTDTNGAADTDNTMDTAALDAGPMSPAW